MRRISPRLSLLLTASLLGGAPPLSAQAAPVATKATFEVGVRGSALRDGFDALWGGSVLLHLHPRLSLGAAGWVLTNRSAIDVPNPGTDLEMALGYGGVLVNVAVHQWSGGGVALRLLAGAGNAKIIIPVVGSEIGWDNFGVLEPEVSASLRLGSGAALRVSGAYLFSYGVQDLAPILPGDLRAFSSGLSVAVTVP